MLSKTEINEYFEMHKMSDAACEYITLVRTSAPSRLVGENTKGNVCTMYPSIKMGCSIQAESRTAEFAYILEFEYDEDVLEYWDQPEPVSVVRTNKNLVKRRGTYTADFLVLTTKGPKIVEIKTEKDIKELLHNKPDDWTGTPDNSRFLPAAEAYKKIGLNFEVLSSGRLNPVRTANLKLLLQVRNYGEADYQDIYEKVRKCLKNEVWMRLSKLIDKCGLQDTTPILKMINDKKLYCMMNEEFLSKPNSVWISSYEVMLRMLYEQWSKETLKKNLPENGEVGLNFVPTEKQAEKAMSSLDRIASGEKSRSVSRWVKLIKEGEAIGLTPFQALIPKTNNSGNKTERINFICKSVLQDFIDNQYDKKIGFKSSYDFYIHYARKRHPEHAEVGYKAFRKYIDFSDQEKIAFNEGGKRKQNAEAGPSDVKDREVKPLLPFEEGTIDHALAKIKLILMVQNGIKYTANPWVTMLIDICTKMILAVWVSFQHPSKISCAITIRNCVRTYGRVPASIVIDGGSDFQSVYFSAMLVNDEIAAKSRPKSHSRFGSEVERMIGDFKTQWLLKRPGSYYSLAKSRSVSGSHSADSFAEMEIADFWDELLQYVEWRNASIIGNQHESPNAQFDRQSKLFPCVGKKVTFDKKYIISTAVDVGNYALDPARGIHVNEMHYWCPELKKLVHKRKRVDIRIEPEDPYRIYAQVDGTWVTCYATGEQYFTQLDPIEKMAETIRKLDGRSIRDMAKGDAHQILIEKIVTNDEKLANKHIDEFHEEVEKDPVVSLASKINGKRKNTLTVTGWED